MFALIAHGPASNWYDLHLALLEHVRDVVKIVL